MLIADLARIRRTRSWSPVLSVLLLTAASAHADDAGNPAPAAVVDHATPRAGRGTFEIAAGYSPDAGPVFGATVAHPDLLRTGHRLALSAEVSSIRQRFALDYRIPELLPGIDLDLQLFGTRRDFGDFTREGHGGQATLSYQLDRSTRIYGRYRIEAVDTALAPIDAITGKRDPRFDSVELGNGTVATLGAGIVHDTLDAPYLPRRGNRLELFAERADRRWGSSYDLERVAGSLDLARAAGPFTLRLHGHASYIRSRDPMGVPLSERLQHDGHAEVRGYALDSLPALGSNLEAVGRVELELPIWKRAGLSIAGWADAGVRHDTDGMFGPTDAPLVQRSLGLSLIWRSPIGPLRLDLALPLDGRDRDRQVLFGLGGFWW